MEPPTPMEAYSTAHQGMSLYLSDGHNKAADLLKTDPEGMSRIVPECQGRPETASVSPVNFALSLRQSLLI